MKFRNSIYLLKTNITLLSTKKTFFLDDKAIASILDM